MNSYNENLHSSIVSSLDDQRLELQQSKSSLDASKFSLYYAQGDKITAAEKLDIDTDKYEVQTKVYDEAVKNSNFSTNVVTVANSGKDHVSTSVSNTAVASANVQIATNAIVKLASDMGAINTIINAADYNTDICSLSEKANDYMGATAYLAEQTSQYSMEASSQIAGVSSSSLADIATQTDTTIKTLLDVSKTDFDNISAVVNTDNDELAASNTAEKAAEGVLADSDVNYCATKSAYTLNNEVLNLDLQVTLNPLFKTLDIPMGPGPVDLPDQLTNVKTANTSESEDPDGSQPEEGTTSDPAAVVSSPNYRVSFDPYTAPYFKGVKPSEEPTPHYPVDQYYILLVDYNRSGNFNISNAESIVSENESDDGSDTGASNPRFYKVDMSTVKSKKTIYSDVLDLSSLQDDQGDNMELGTNYVVFVYAILSNKYKKAINTYDDYLSAPSMYFALTDKIDAPNGRDVTVLTDSVTIDGMSKKAAKNYSDETPLDTQVSITFDSQTLGLQSTGDDQTISYSFDGGDTQKAEITKTDSDDTADPVSVQSMPESKQIVVFPIDKLTMNGQDLEYRCMFLPYDKELTEGCMTSGDLKYLEVSTRMLEEIVQLFNLKQEQEQSKISDLLIAKNKAVEKKASIETDLKDTTLSKAKQKKSQADLNAVNDEIDSIGSSLQASEQALEDLIAQQDFELSKYTPTIGEKPGFYFDMTIATRVTAANYTVAEILTVTETESDPNANSDDTNAHNYGVIEIKEDTTDNFGNRLIDQNQYLPVILVLPEAGTASITQQFTNGLSQIKLTKEFTYIA